MAEKSCVNPRMNRVGGQAVLEGVMMRCGDNVALSVRKEDGSISTDKRKYTSVRKKHKILNIPIVRGVINMVESFKLSYATLGKSAEMLGIDDAEPESRFEKWLTDKLGDKLMGVIMGIAMVLGVALALFLFSFLPTFVVKKLGDVVDLGWFRNLIQGLIKIGLFVGYILLVSLMPDIRRTFEYHGAEHKSIACYESGDELTPENAIKHIRFHPRCGTSFIFVTLILSILVFSFLPWTNVFLRVGLQILFLPLVIGLSFEFIMYAGRHNNVLTKILSAPGLAMQRITTREPDLKELEVAITSLKAAMPDEFPPEAAEDETDVEGESEAAEGPAEDSFESTPEDGDEVAIEPEAAENATEASATDGTDAIPSDKADASVENVAGSAAEGEDAQ